MDRMDVAATAPSEGTSLLDQTDRHGSSSPLTTASRSGSYYLLAVPFLGALAIAATAATEIFAYAAILCKDPRHCRDEEKNRFASTVAIAVGIANFCSLFALGPFIVTARRSPRLVLLVWTMCRSISVIALVIGVHVRSVIVVLSGRVFEGLASDNLLHFSLNTIYVYNAGEEGAPQLISASLAVYMIGICLAPLLGSASADFRTSFYLSLGIFAIMATYLLIVPIGGHNMSADDMVSSSTVSSSREARVKSGEASSEQGYTWRSPLRPLLVLMEVPRILFPWTSLLFYNMVQSFVFALTMTYTTIRFGFTGRENGYLLSLVHVTAAASLLVSCIVLPRVSKEREVQEDGEERQTPTLSQEKKRIQTSLRVLAFAAILLETLSIVLLGFAHEAWQVYPVVLLLALGISAPSYLKGLVVTVSPQDQAGEAMAALTVAETMGSLVGPIVLGSLLATKPERVVFFVATGVLTLSDMTLAVSAIVDFFSRPDQARRESND